MIPADFPHWLATQQERRDAIGSLARAVQKNQSLWGAPQQGTAPSSLLRAYQLAWDAWIASGGHGEPGKALEALEAPLKASSCLTLTLEARVPMVTLRRPREG